MKSAFYFAVIAYSIFFSGCAGKPVIHSFTVRPLTITADDTVKVNWDVKGTPTLLVHEKETADSAIKTLEITLVATKGDKEVNRPVQVTVVPKNTATQITFSTSLSGDTLVAAGNKNPEKWGDRFEILSVSSASNRTLIVSHANRTAVLDSTGVLSAAFAGTPVEGRWVLKYVLTAAEKKDMSTAPETLQLNTTIQYKRR